MLNFFILLLCLNDFLIQLSRLKNTYWRNLKFSVNVTCQHGIKIDNVTIYILFLNFIRWKFLELIEFITIHYLAIGLNNSYNQFSLTALALHLLVTILLLNIRTKTISSFGNNLNSDATLELQVFGNEKFSWYFKMNFYF